MKPSEKSISRNEGKKIKKVTTNKCARSTPLPPKTALLVLGRRKIEMEKKIIRIN
jgi:hypothetical protein